MTFGFRALLVAAFVGAVSPQLVPAQGKDVESMVRRIDSLERRILELERRVARIEGGATSEPARNSTATAGNARDIANWRRLRDGMSYDEVRAILGEPERVRGGGVAFWTYPRGGEVGFVSGRVTSWSEPGRQ